MRSEIYRYTFATEAPLEEIAASLLLALFAVESLHGQAQTRLDAAHYLDAQSRACVIDAATAVGRDLNRIFTGFLAREFGAGSFHVERLAAGAVREPQAAGA
jgi:hypothetical protein